MKKILSIALAAAMMLGLASCGRTEAQNGGMTDGNPPAITLDQGVDEPNREVAGEDARREDGVKSAIGEIADLMMEAGLATAYSEIGTESGWQGFEHQPVSSYVIDLVDGDSVMYVKIYDSAETAEDEANNYLDGDASHYASDGESANGEAFSMMIDYAMPTYMYRRGEAIIDLGTWKYDIYQKVEDVLGTPFAGSGGIEPPADGDRNPDTDPGEEQPDVPEKDDTVDGAAVVGDLKAFDAKVVNLAAVNSDNFEKMGAEPTLISSYDELKSFMSDNETALSNDECKEALNYSEKYFRDSSLLVAPIFESTIHENYRLENINIDSKAIDITLKSTDTGAEGLDFNLMVMELKGMKFDKLVTKLKVESLAEFGKLRPVETNLPAGAAMSYSWDKIRTDGSGYPRQLILNSTADCKEYYESLSDFSNRLDEVKAKLDGYDNSWFENHSLIIVAVEYGSGSTEVSVAGVESVSGGVAVTLKTQTPEVGTCDMAGWQLFIETQKLTGGETVTVRGSVGTVGNQMATE